MASRKLLEFEFLERVVGLARVAGPAGRDKILEVGLTPARLRNNVVKGGAEQAVGRVRALGGPSVVDREAIRELQREGVQDGEEDCRDPAVPTRERVPPEDFQFLGSGERGAFHSLRWIIEADTVQMAPIAIARKTSYCGDESLEQLLLGARHGVQPIAPAGRCSTYSGVADWGADRRFAWKGALPIKCSLLAQRRSPDTCRGADELFRRGVLDPKDRALDQVLAAQPRLVSRRGQVNKAINNRRNAGPPTEEA